MPTATSPLDLANTQGDILIGLPKKVETFFFFNINNGVASTFRAQLNQLIPLIATGTQCQKDIARIAAENKRAKDNNTQPQIIDMSGITISFSQKGLTKLGITDDMGDSAFKSGQFADVSKFSDDPSQWDPAFKAGVHGVIYISGSSFAVVDAQLAKVKAIFAVGSPQATIAEAKVLKGQTRPGKESGHEHFGFLDGVSQPAVQGVTTPAQSGQELVAPGVILLGREGDNGVVPPGGRPAGVTRPSWALDGSFLAFRYLPQLVPEFNRFLEANALPIVKPLATGISGADFLGARLIGRWKSGAPIDLSPFQDDPEMANNPAQVDAFRFDPTSQLRCPFAAHIRKTNPRSDLDAFGGTQVRRILRRGLQFGPEVTPAEDAAKKSSTDPKLERGLLFACYQSNIENGFQFMQQSWVNNESFPPGKTLPPGQVPGIDAIIGQAPVGTARGLVGTDPNAQTKDLQLPTGKPAPWVLSKGGEYFFSPSISALKNTFAQPAGHSGL